MKPALALPSLSELGLDRDNLLDALRRKGMPRTHVLGAAILYAEEIEHDIVHLLDRARTQDLDDASVRLLFRGLYILSGRRLAGGYRACIAFLREGGERVGAVLGYAITEDLAKILAGLFDGDTGPLVALISANDVDEYVRQAALKAFCLLAFDGRVERAFAEEFLRQFEQESGAPPNDVVWDGWAASVALLGIEDLLPRIQSATPVAKRPFASSISSLRGSEKRGVKTPLNLPIAAAFRIAAPCGIACSLTGKLTCTHDNGSGSVWA